MVLNSLHFGYYYDRVRNKGKALVGRYMLVVMGAGRGKNLKQSVSPPIENRHEKKRKYLREAEEKARKATKRSDKQSNNNNCERVIKKYNKRRMVKDKRAENRCISIRFISFPIISPVYLS